MSGNSSRAPSPAVPGAPEPAGPLGLRLGTPAAIFLFLARDLAHVSLRVGAALFGAVALVALAGLAPALLLRRLALPPTATAILRRLAIAVLFVLPLGLPLYRFAVHPASMLAWAVPALLVAAVVAARLLPRLRLPDTAATWSAVAYAGLLLLGISLATHLEEGTFEAVRPGTERLHFGLFAGLWLVATALALVVGLRLAGQELARRPRLVLTGAALLGGLVLGECDHRFFVGLYPAVHLWLRAAGFLALDAGLGIGLGIGIGWIGRRAARVLGVAATGLLAASGAAVLLLGTGHLDPVMRAKLARTTVGRALVGLGVDAPRRIARGLPAEHPLLRYPRFYDVAPPPNDWNILLVTIDALRADQIARGAAAPPAPRLAALARESVDFSRVYAAGTRTPIAMGALMLGRYSADLDWELWLTNGAWRADPRKMSRERLDTLAGKYVFSTLPRPIPGGMLASRLQAKGLTTMATPFGNPSPLFKRGESFEVGFDRYQDLFRERWELPTSGRVADAAIEQLRTAPPGRWFQWVHFFDPHESNGDRARYASLVEATDGAVGRLLDTVSELGLRERTVVVVLADHGEAFGEHLEVGHASSLYDEQTRVPLLVRVPGLAPRVEPALVSAIDVTATLLTLAGAEVGGIDGVNLLPLLLEGRYPQRRPVFTELHRYFSQKGERTMDIKAVVLDDWKLIVDRRLSTRELFDLAADPGEQHNRAGDERARLEELEGLLESFVERAEALHPLP